MFSVKLFFPLNVALLDTNKVPREFDCSSLFHVHFFFPRNLKGLTHRDKIVRYYQNNSASNLEEFDHINRYLGPFAQRYSL